MQIVTGDWDALKQALISLRTEVFIVEQKVPVALEWDEDDATALHVLLRDNDDSPMGCARLLPSGQIGRMAVLAQRRREGLGSMLLEAAEEVARKQQKDRVFLHAQVHALPFYIKHGYEITSDEFIDAGIPHRAMIKRL